AWGAPPTDLVLAELRHRHNRGERHLHADHQVPIERRPDLRLDLDNLRTRCDRCHQAKTRAGGKGVGGLIFTIARAKRPWPTLAQKFPGFELFQLWTTK